MGWGGKKGTATVRGDMWRMENGEWRMENWFVEEAEAEAEEAGDVCLVVCLSVCRGGGNILLAISIDRWLRLCYCTVLYCTLRVWSFICCLVKCPKSTVPRKNVKTSFIRSQVIDADADADTDIPCRYSFKPNPEEEKCSLCGERWTTGWVIWLALGADWSWGSFQVELRWEGEGGMVRMVRMVRMGRRGWMDGF